MKSICEYLEEDERKWKDRPYIHVWRKGKFQAVSFGKTISDIKNLGKALNDRGLHGKNIMIYSENSYEWMVLYLSIMGYVGKCVPVDKEWTEFDIRNTLSVLDIDAVFYSQKKKECIKKLQKVYPSILCVCIEEEFLRYIAAGAKSSSPLEGERNLQKTVMILFTSGTTNVPKAIPLTQANLFNNWETLYQRTPMREDDISYVFLPLNHVYSGVANFLYSIISGMQLYLCSDITKIIEEMLLVRPTVVCMVPLILSRVYETVTNETAQTERIMEMLRGIRFLYCGGSFTDLTIKKFFISQGVHLLEAYGTTETSSVIALDIIGDLNIDSNGVIFENLDVKISEPDENGVGEILVKGGSVSSGYLSRNDHYSEFDSEGYYHTGDLGRIDETRHLYIKGRKKRMIVTENAKNVYVDEMEELLLQNPNLQKAVIFEEDHHIAVSVIGNLSREEVTEYVEEINRKLPKYKRIKNIYVRMDVPGGRIK